MGSRITLLGSGLALGLLLSGCGSMASEAPGSPTPGACDMKALRSSLSAAKPGATVRLGACTAAGTLTVPAGVKLVGAGVGSSVINAPAGQAGVQLTPSSNGQQPTTLSGVTVVSTSGSAGVLAQGQGHVALSQVDVEAQLGIGVGAERLTSLKMTDVTLTGPVAADPGMASRWGDEDAMPASVATPAAIATHGLVLVDVSAAQLAGVSSYGFVGYGALLVRSTVEPWAGGTVAGNAGVGLMAVGGRVTVEDVELSRTLRGGFSFPAYGGLFVSEQALTEGAVLAMGGAAVTLDRVRALDNEGPGLAYADGSSFTVRGLPEWTDVETPDPPISGNRFAGLLVMDARGVTVENMHVRETLNASLPLGEEDMPISGGEGVRIVRSVNEISFSGVRTTANVRGGMLLDLRAEDYPAPGQMEWTNVNVHGNEVFGAVCQAGGQVIASDITSGGNVSETGWDMGIDRGDEKTVLEDGAWTSVLEEIGAISPCFFPSPLNVLTGGLSVLVGR